MSYIVAFAGNQLLGYGDAADVAVAMKHAFDAGEDRPVLAFDAQSSHLIEIDLRGTEADVRARFAPAPQIDRGRGRPKLGVTPREVTLLPRHWEWLAEQPGGASAAIRRLIEDARRRDKHAHDLQAGKEALYRFMTAMAGNEPRYEEALRALFAGERHRFETEINDWPRDLREHVLSLATAAFRGSEN
jgi:hypothetical protein